MSTGNAEQSSMVCDHCAAKLGDVTLEVNQIFGLLSCVHVVEVDIFVTPLKIMNDSFIGELLLEDKDILEEVQNALFDIKVIELSDHSLLILKIPLVLVNQSISLVNDAADVVKD